MVAMAMSKLARFKARMAKASEVAQKKIDVAVGALEVSGTAGAFGFLRGRYPSKNKKGEVTDDFAPGGIPLNLIVAGGAHIGALFMPDSYAFHVHNVGTGALSDFTSHQAFKLGQRLREEKKPAASGPRRLAPNQRFVSPWAQYDPFRAAA